MPITQQSQRQACNHKRQSHGERGQRGNAGQPLRKSSSSHDAKTKLVEGRGALTNLVEGPQDVCEPRPSEVFR